MTPLRIALYLATPSPLGLDSDAIPGWLARESRGYFRVVSAPPDRALEVADADVFVVLGVATDFAGNGRGDLLRASALPVIWWPATTAPVAVSTARDITVVRSRDELLGALWMHEMRRDFCALEVP